jgi:DNA-binding NarL/FixJ family response regulator
MPESISVLIVEDHQVTLDGLKMGLSSQAGLDVVGSATTSDEGLELADKLRPDIILLDLHLPGKQGPKSMIQSFCNIAGSRVIVFSGESRMAFIQTVLAVGAAGYLLKSETISKVAETIREVMGGKRFVISKELIGGETNVTRSEQDVLKMLAHGMKYQDIADRRTTSPATVRKQCELLLLKLGLNSREELIAWAVKNGYGSLEIEV